MNTVTMPALFPLQLEILQHSARFKVAACGRRFGKSKLGVAATLETALTGDPAWWVAPTYKIAAVGWNDLRFIARQIPHAEIRDVDRIVRFPGGGSAEVRSADDPDSLRGHGLKRVVLDEAALIAEAAWTQALRPALADLQGDAYFLFSPKGRNWVYRLYLRGQDDAEPQYASWNLPTAANPTIAAAEIADARRDMPERWFRQEFLAEFLDDAGGVFRHVRAAVRDRETSGLVFIGGDWGQVTDYTVFTAIQGGHVIDLDRFNDIGWDLQFGRLKAFCDRHEPALVLLEQNSMGGPLLERAQAELGWPVQGFLTTAQTKRPLIDALALDVELGEFTMPEWAMELVNELEAFEYTTTAGGQVRFSAPAGYHDDCVMSAALARWAETRMGAVSGSFGGRAPKPRPGVFAGIGR